MVEMRARVECGRTVAFARPALWRLDCDLERGSTRLHTTESTMAFGGRSSAGAWRVSTDCSEHGVSRQERTLNLGKVRATVWVATGHGRQEPPRMLCPQDLATSGLQVRDEQVIAVERGKGGREKLNRCSSRSSVQLHNTAALSDQSTIRSVKYDRP